MNVSIIVSILLGLLFLAQGISILINKERAPQLRAFAKKYTEESVRKFVPIYGGSMIGIGVLMGAACLFTATGNKSGAIALFVVLVLLCAVLIGGFCTVLKKKD